MNFKSIGKDRSDDKFLYMSNLDLTIKNSIISTNNKFPLLSDTPEWYHYRNLVNKFLLNGNTKTLR